MRFEIAYFLGTNTGDGFYSLLDTLSRYDGIHHTYILKGGPGTGKSFLMKQIAKRAKEDGYFCEEITCPSDPDSLDAVYIPQKHFSICDGTPPHTVEPKMPGVCEQILNLGDFWDCKAIGLHTEKIKNSMEECKYFHAKTANLLGSAKRIQQDAFTLSERLTDTDKLLKYTEKLAKRIPDRTMVLSGNIEHRFLSGMTPKGIVCHAKTVKKLATDITVFKDECGFTSHEIIKSLAKKATQNGYDIILCYDLLLTDTFAHLIIPELSLAFVTEKADAHFSLSHAKQIAMSRFIPRKHLDFYKANTEKDMLLLQEIFAQCKIALESAKSAHDQLENCYFPYMDFQKADTLKDALLQKIFEE